MGIDFLGTSMAWNTTGITVAGTGVSGTAANQFNQPWSIFLNSNNDLYVADAYNHRIQLWTSGASSGTTIAGTTNTAGSSATLLNTPSDIFVDNSGNFYVADRVNNRIQFFRNGSTTGITVTTGWGTVGNFRGVVVSSSNMIYGSDTSNGALWRNATVQLGYNGAGGGSNQLNSPQGIALDSTVNVGTVYIANTNQHTVVQWTPGSSTGTVVAGSNGVSGSTNQTLRSPVGVRLDSNGNLYVVDNNNHRIQLYCRYPTVSSNARTIAGTGNMGSTATTLNYPAGMALDSNLNLYVADTSNHRIQKFVRIV